jgi:hypothetical protein
MEIPMSAENDYLERITDPLIELLAIKLFEHSGQDEFGLARKTPKIGWMQLLCEDRQFYRDIARGKELMGYIPSDFQKK